MNDNLFTGLPWKAGGRTRAGVDCVGLALLWQQAHGNLAAVPDCRSEPGDCEKFLQPLAWAELRGGETIFFREKRSGKIAHVATHVGGGRLLHIVNGFASRVDNGPKLLARVGLTPVGMVPSDQFERLCRALADPALGAIPHFWGWVILALILSAISALIMPGLSGFKSKSGRYGPNALLTMRSPEQPLPDLLGAVVVAGNQVYLQVAAQGDSPTSATSHWNQIVVLASGPVSLIDYYTGLQVNGISWQDSNWYSGTNLAGITIHPAQTKAEAVTGSIAGGTAVPSLTLYDAAHAIAVPVDVRAQYDRGFPVYGLSGCAYLVLRAIDSTKFSSLNFTARVRGRLLRTFDENGFITASVSQEYLLGADGTKVRFKMANADVIAVSALTVDGTGFTEISASNQAGNVFQLNRTKGFVEFISPPSNGVELRISYTYYPRVWSQNPAALIVYLLTDALRGKGVSADRINWPMADALQDACAESITWISSNGTVTRPRYTADYAVDDRKAISDHLQQLLDACHAILFLSNGKIAMKTLGAATSLFSFNTSNIIVENGVSTLEVELVDRRARPNRMPVFFHSEETLNAEDEAVAEDEADQAIRSARAGDNGVVSVDLKMAAVSTRDQAERLGEMYLRESVLGGKSYRWKTDVQGLALEPGDLVDITHAGLGIGDPVLVRLDAIALDADDRLQLSASEYVPAATF